MAAGVFVEERAVEKHAGIANGAVEGDESHFTQAAGVLVGLHDGAQNVFACFCMQINHAAVFECEAEIVDQAAVVGKRHGGDHGAFCTHAVGGVEKISSVGMFGKNCTPSTVSPPLNKCFLVRSPR